MSPDEAHARSRLEREVDYYKREVNQLGAELMRAREEQSSATRDARRTRLMFKLVREVYRLGDFGGAEADVEQAVLGLIVENAMCDRAMLLLASSRDAGRFRVLCALGGNDPQRVGSELTLRRPPRFCYTTRDSTREGQSAEMCSLIGTPYILWGYDPGIGFGILLGNQRESNASLPFEAADQELVETALSVYLDIVHRKREVRQLERSLETGNHSSEAQAESEQAFAQPPEKPGIEEVEIQQQLGKGGRLTGFLVVDRSDGGGPQFVAYVRCSWAPGYRLLRTYRLVSDKKYKDASRLIHLARFEYGYTAPIVVYVAGAPELRRFAGVWPRDVSP